MSVSISNTFRKMAIRAIFSIILFVVTYLVLFALAVGLTILCGYAGIMLIILKPMAITLGIGIGLVSMGALVIFFLIKFLFKKHTVDRSHLTEISRSEEPALFNMIEEIVKEVKTDFPKKIYLSSDVNAAVFYDSSFWSMFLPVKKNLQIGMGLINTVSVLELKAILAHEFGHFSQRSMKLGSYVYNVNQIIYNMLYDNRSYGEIVQSWANASGYIAFFANISLKIAEGIQQVLKKNYKLINISYMSLAREMEFHADEVAANVAGSGPLISSLLRLDLSNSAMNSVLEYYNHRIDQSITTKNIYTQQSWMMHELAKDAKLETAGSLPLVPVAFLGRYNRSKLVIKDQWASHPSTEDRIDALNRLAIHKEEDDHTMASSIFRNPLAVQERITAQLFSVVTYKEAVTTESDATFISTNTQMRASNAFPDVFNGYYDNWAPSTEAAEGTTSKTMDELFGNDAIATGYTLQALENDLRTLGQLADGNHSIKTFDYDGVKYTIDDVPEQQQKVTAELEETRALLKQHDADIYRYFAGQAAAQGRERDFQEHFQPYAMEMKHYGEHYMVYVNMRNATIFMQDSLPYADIEQHLKNMEEPETVFRAEVKRVLQENIYQQVMTEERRDILERYANTSQVYFETNHYNNDAVHLLYEAMEQYYFVISRTVFELKKKLLDFEAQLVEVPVF